MKDKPSSGEVVCKLLAFYDSYGQWRKNNGLARKIGNIHEICNAMTDKHGRICRYVKHQERQDPKEDWPQGLIEALMGYFVYSAMLLEYYKLKEPEQLNGFLSELNKAVQQHKK
jgi:hypothetical protein